MPPMRSHGKEAWGEEADYFGRPARREDRPCFSSRRLGSRLLGNLGVLRGPPAGMGLLFSCVLAVALLAAAFAPTADLLGGGDRVQASVGEGDSSLDASVGGVGGSELEGFTTDIPSASAGASDSGNSVISVSSAVICPDGFELSGDRSTCERTEWTAAFLACPAGAERFSVEGLSASAWGCRVDLGEAKKVFSCSEGALVSTGGGDVCEVELEVVQWESAVGSCSPSGVPVSCRYVDGAGVVRFGTMVFSCQQGWNLSGGTCSRTLTSAKHVPPAVEEVCDAGALAGGRCYGFVEPVLSCAEGWVLMSGSCQRTLRTPPAPVGDAISSGDTTATVGRPGRPSSFRASPSVAGSLNLSWTRPTSDGGSPLLGYKVEWRTGLRGPWSSTLISSAAVTSYVVSGLSGGVKYYLRVRARNASHASFPVVTSGVPNSAAPPAAATTTTTVAVGKPGVPTNPSVEPGPLSAVVSWDTPTSDGGSPIVGYSVEWRLGSGGWQPEDPVELPAGSRSYVITGLTGGGNYMLRLKSKNASYSSSAVNKSFRPCLASQVYSTSLRKCVSAPSAPRDATLISLGKGAITYLRSDLTVFWRAPSSDGGSPLTGYRVSWRRKGGGAWSSEELRVSDLNSLIVSSSRGALYWHGINGLFESTIYEVQISALNEAGSGAAAKPGEFCYGRPFACTSSRTQPASCVSATSRYFTGEYYSRIRERCYRVPKPPLLLDVRSGDGSLSVNWLSNHGWLWERSQETTIESYKLEWKPLRSSEDWSSVTVPWDRGTSSRDRFDGEREWSYTIEGLKNGTDYTVRLSARNSETGTHQYGSYQYEYGNGVPCLAGRYYSQALQSCELRSTPSKPQSVSVGKYYGASYVTRFDWSKPADFGGSPIIDYTVRWKVKGSSEAWSTATVKFEDLTSLRDPRLLWEYWMQNLKLDTRYVIEVAARNSSGIGNYASVDFDSCVINQTYSASEGKCLGKPSHPPILSGSHGTNTYTLKWKAPESDGGSPVLRYVLSWQPRPSGNQSAAIINWDQGTLTTMGSSQVRTWSYTITGLSSSTRYQLKLAAVTSKGYGAGTWRDFAICPSGQVFPDDATNNACVKPVSAPTNLRVASEDGSLMLYWSRPAGSTKPMEYRIRWRQGTSGSWSETRLPIAYETPVTVGADSFQMNSYRLEYLTNDVSYQIGVSADNFVTTSGYTATSGVPCVSGKRYSRSLNRCVTPPSEPRSVSAVSGNGSLTVRWKQPASNGGDLITGYEIAFLASWPGQWTTIPLRLGELKQITLPGVGAVYTHTVTGLANNTDYRIGVAAKNMVGSSLDSRIMGMPCPTGESYSPTHKECRTTTTTPATTTTTTTTSTPTNPPASTGPLSATVSAPSYCLAHEGRLSATGGRVGVPSANVKYTIKGGTAPYTVTSPDASGWTSSDATGSVDITCALTGLNLSTVHHSVNVVESGPKTMRISVTDSAGATANGSVVVQVVENAYTTEYNNGTMQPGKTYYIGGPQAWRLITLPAGMTLRFTGRSTIGGYHWFTDTASGSTIVLHSSGSEILRSIKTTNTPQTSGALGASMVTRNVNLLFNSLVRTTFQPSSHTTLQSTILDWQPYPGLPDSAALGFASQFLRGIPIDVCINYDDDERREDFKNAVVESIEVWRSVLSNIPHAIYRLSGTGEMNDWECIAPSSVNCPPASTTAAGCDSEGNKCKTRAYSKDHFCPGTITIWDFRDNQEKCNTSDQARGCFTPYWKSKGRTWLKVGGSIRVFPLRVNVRGVTEEFELRRVLIHELGHYLGLADYAKDCSSFTEGEQSTFAYPWMPCASARVERPLGELITSRDLNDLHQIYHVDARLNVGLEQSSGNWSLNIGEPASDSKEPTSSGDTTPEFNAYEYIVLRRTAGSSSAPEFVAKFDRLDINTKIDLPERSVGATANDLINGMEFIVVGITQGDIRRDSTASAGSEHSIMKFSVDNKGTTDVESDDEVVAFSSTKPAYVPEVGAEWGDKSTDVWGGQPIPAHWKEWTLGEPAVVYGPPTLVPTGLSAVSGAESVILNWTSVPGAASYKIAWDTDETVRGCSDGSMSYALPNAPDADASTNHSTEVTGGDGLCADVSHSFTVKAVVGSSYESSASSSVSAVPRMVATPLNLRKTSVTANSVGITWNRVKWETAGSLSYEVRRDGGTPVSKPGSTPSHVFTGLSAGTKYKFEARAVVARNDETRSYSDWTAISLSTHPLPPATPTRLRVTAADNESVSLTWNASARAESYEIRYKPTGDTTYSNTPSVGVAKKISDLDSWVLYGFQVRAVNAGGESAWSTLINRRTSEQISGTIEMLRFSHFTTDRNLLFAFLTEDKIRIYAGTSKRYSDLTYAWTTIGTITRTTASPSQRLGQIVARKTSVRNVRNRPYFIHMIEVCFLPSGSATRICPEKNSLRYSRARLNRWYTSNEFSFMVDSSATVVGGSSEETNQDPLDRVLPPGVELGPFDPVKGNLK